MSNVRGGSSTKRMVLTSSLFSPLEERRGANSFLEEALRPSCKHRAECAFIPFHREEVEMISFQDTIVPFPGSFSSRIDVKSPWKCIK